MGVSMFIFGTNDFSKLPGGTERCNADGCSCYCEKAASDDGKCEQTDHLGYRLFKFVGMYSYQNINRHSIFFCKAL